MEFAALKSIFSRLKTSDIVSGLMKWTHLNRQQRTELTAIVSGDRKTKISVVTELIDHLKKMGGLTMEVVGDLDLIYTQNYASKKEWSVYYLTGKIESISADVSRSPEKFKAKLKKQIRLYFNKTIVVSVVLLDGLLWGRVYFPGTNRVYNPRQNLYFIYYPESPIIIFTGMKASYTSFLSQCLVSTLNYEDLTSISLTGRHYPSLAELAMNKQMEGGFSLYKSISGIGGPLNAVTSRKRKASSPLEDSAVIDLNRSQKRQRVELLDTCFGENVQPTVEKVQFKVELPFRSHMVGSKLHDGSELFHSTVSFKGPSVLEGFRNLATTGHATTPLPKLITTVPKRARNNFILAKPSSYYAKQNKHKTKL